MAGRTDPFDWSGGRPALDLINTLDERPSNAPIDNLANFKALVNFTELAGLIEPAAAARLRPLNGPACARVTRQVRALREHAYAAIVAVHGGRAVPKATLDAITAEVRRAHAAQTFASSGKSHAITWRWERPTSPEVALHACALAVEELLLSADHSRIRKCGATDCAVYFIDTSKAHRRQWCSMKNCGNREKQRRWRSVTA